MKIIIKNLQSISCEIDIDPSCTIAEVKELFCKKNKHLFPSSELKLIHKGRVLKNESTVDSYSIAPNDKLVAMNPVSQDLTRKNEKDHEREKKINEIVALGFPRDHAEHALEKFKDNPNNALEYLLGQSEETGETEEGSIERKEDTNKTQFLSETKMRIGEKDIALFIFIAVSVYLQIEREIRSNGIEKIEVALTQTDIESVERLMALGFDRDTAVQAFLACEKDEEMAANFLFETNQNN